MSSNICPCTIVPTSISGTLTGGIQDIAALLPLLGTEQCEDHVSSALTNGYLYAAAAPMSLFGSLGLARAGFKTFLASFSIPTCNVVGARTLSNMGFKPQGMNLSLIMVDPNDKDGRYLVETRLDKLVEELHIDKAKVQDVVHQSIGWNLRMVTLSAALCTLSMAPYVFLNDKTGNSLPHHTRWTLPALRAVGGFLTTAMMQFVIQRRIATLAQRWISAHCSNKTTATEEGNVTGDRTGDIENNTRVRVTDSNSPLTWCLLFLLLLGVLTSVVGYVGCFSVVQSANGSTGPLSWLCLEAGLSLLRMFLWGCNPSFDDAPPLQLVLARNPYPPLPTCKLYNHDIEREKILPLTRANQFLNSITSFTGVVERFDHPDVTLYYTLTRKAFTHSDSHKPGEHILYITIFDHKERANTMVYVQRSGVDHFYATESSLPVIDPKQGLLEITLGVEINNQGDPITSDLDLRIKLNAHYRSIMGQMYLAMRQPKSDSTYRIENKWTMAMFHTTSTRPSGGGDVTDNDTKIRTSSRRDFRYLQHGRMEKTCQSVYSARGEWIATYVNWGIREIKRSSMHQASTGMANHVDEVLTVRTTGDMESQMIDQIRRMELLLVQEMEIWEEHLCDQANKFIDRSDVLEKARLTEEWKRGFKTRLDSDIRAMEARFGAAEQEVRTDEPSRKWQSLRDDIRKVWQALAEKAKLSSPPTDPSHLEHLQTEYEKTARDIEAIIGWSQLTAAHREHLLQQSEVASRSTIELKEAVLWMDHTSELVECKISRSKWLHLDLQRFTEPPEVYSRALRTMNDAIFVSLYNVNSDDHAQVAEFIDNLPSVTSILVCDYQRFPVIRRDTPLFINDWKGSNRIETFLSDNQWKLARTRRTHVFIDTGHIYPSSPLPAILGPFDFWSGFKIAVSFFGPPSGNLVLKLAHSSENTTTTLFLKEPGNSRTFEYPVPSSFTTTSITLFPSPSDHPSFAPNARNNIIIRVSQSNPPGYMLQDIRLHDEEGNDYNAAPPEA